MADEYLVNIVLKARDEGMKAFAEMGASLAAMVAEAKIANEELKRLSETSTEHGNALHNMSLDTKRAADEVGNLAKRLESDLTPAMNNSNTASRSAQSGLLAFVQGAIPGGQTAGNIAIAVAAAAVAFAPFTAELAASLVLLGAWVVGMTAFLAVVGIAAVGILGLTAGFGALAIAAAGGVDPLGTLEKAQKALATATNQAEAAQESQRLAQLRYDAKPTAVNLQALKDANEQLVESQQKQVDAQNAVNAATVNANAPFSVLHEKIVAIGQALGQQAVPMLQQTSTVMLGLLPLIQPLGEQLLQWFGNRLPVVLDELVTGFYGLKGALETISVAWGKVIDEVLSHPFEYNRIFGTFFDLFVRGIVGLLDNLVRLSDWFIARFPVLEKNAEDTFGHLGIAVQAIGFALGAVVDWVIAHWPQINRIFDETWAAFVEGWKAASPVFELLRQTFIGMMPLFDFMGKHLGELKILADFLAIAIVLLIAVIAAAIIILVAIAAAIVGVATVISALAKQIGSEAPSMGAQFSALGSAAQQMGHDIGGVFSVIGSGMHQLGLTIQTEVRQGGEQFSALVQAGRQMGSDIGGVLQGIGGGFHQLGINIQTEVSAGGAQFSALGKAAKTMAQDIGGAFSGLGKTIHDGLHGVSVAIDNFGTAVNAALHPFGLPTITAVHYATGGVVPGYAPGQDSVLAMLSPGEGVLTPQTVRAMGGEGAIKALNAGQGVTDMGGIAATIGAIGGQCVEFLQNLLGLTYHGNANTWVNAPYAHTQTGAPGMLAVFLGGMYGHLALVTKMITDSIFDVLDSNWVAPGVIGAHTMSKSMYGFATFLNPGISAPGGIGQFLAGIPGITSPADLLNGLVGKALGGLGGWEGDLAKGILGQAVKGITHSLGFDGGGGLPPGGTLAWNGTGRTETVTPASTMDRIENLLAGIVERLNGQGNNITVSVQTKADPYDIAREIAWAMKTR